MKTQGVFLARAIQEVVLFALGYSQALIDDAIAVRSNKFNSPSRPRQHFRGHVDANHFARALERIRGQEAVHPGAAPEVQGDFARLKRCQLHGGAAAQTQIRLHRATYDHRRTK